ncbi:hypothetical protein JQ580_32785 [Bradyrhizobium japonicum]|uniref:hypothetical protein n=1 Tax=Bradyrhizobium japonicum TaxID=375 RepID=UPI001BABFD11|nr:hypothetical protein [Bradyrhizobium japonicum]MBR0995499.1 hypothetical protein [Bradyrhizobium japonicum]
MDRKLRRDDIEAKRPDGLASVILGKLQLFTESTVTAVLPLPVHPTFRNLGRPLCLRTIVFAANMVGAFFVALLMANVPAHHADR